MQKKISRLISGFWNTLQKLSFCKIYILAFTKLIEYNVIKFMKQFESNKLPEGFENEWSRRLVEGGDGYMLRNLNDLHLYNEPLISHMLIFGIKGNTLPMMIL